MVTVAKNAPRGATSAPRQTLTVVDNRTGKSYELPIKQNSVLATDIKKIKAARGNDRPEDETDQGLRVYDPAYMNTAVVQSNITYINGQEGILRYRGYPIQQLVNKSHFLESAFLLIYGELPTSSQYSKWQDEIMHHTYIHSDIEGMFKSFRYDTHPMAMLQASFSSLGAFAPESNPSLQGQKLYTNAASGDVNALKMLDKQILRIIGKAPTLAAASYRMRQGRPFNRPAQGLSYTGNFLYLLDHLSGHEYQPHPVLERALDALFIIHADHEVNCSTATVLQVGSSLVDPYSVVSAGCAALYGPSHGGASESAIRMLMEIGSPENVPAFMQKVEKRERVLVGFGHRVYKNVDPRSTAIRQLAEEVFAVTGRNQLLDTALELAKYARESEFMKKRNLYPNVDFYSGLIYQAMGFPLDFYPVLFAVPRCVGWLAHWRQQMLQKGGVKIWRPRQLYVGEGEREYIEAEKRQEKQNKSVFDEPAQVSHGGDSKRNELATYKDEMGHAWRGRSKL
ncbi:peroxysomal citrate synthase [Colletotrichum tofieldiae]|uniref:Citrate synthase n=2 Tax=Colletotrichum spaethianum species complex TaxID=2707349 RepID=A0A166W4N5_9PEZI|nr:peroxysomal citrate synthase [Colletotrichum tofieldiae]GJC88007.1 citrate synthase [Colletotrichum liriopes]GKT65604.1 peroxysomal citrate synthase [Colletotrichum tofieldiae]GKT71209.1 peroxysomal citrate synthase [Colletotrichum tofieldiae]GKT93878.1 peroxysomal citrate synthase [Colletotrichum tofieldiae]